MSVVEDITPSYNFGADIQHRFEGFLRSTSISFGSLKSLFDRQSDPFAQARIWDTLHQHRPNKVLELFDEAFESVDARIKGVDEGKYVYGGYSHFKTYENDSGKSFINELTYNENRGAAENRLSQLHEKFHSLQWSTIPELHAIHYNMMTYQDVPVVLSPRSWITASLLTEREAYAKTAWLALLENHTEYDEEFAQAASQELVNPDDVAEWYKRYPDDLGFALGEASLRWDNLIRAKAGENNRKVKLRDHYIELAINQYDNCYRFNECDWAHKPVFIDLDDRAILALGASFGPSIFGKYYPDPVFKNTVLTPEQEDMVQKLEAKLGIVTGQKLPTLREALANKGLSPEQFLERSKNFIFTHPGHEIAPTHPASYELLHS